MSKKKQKTKSSQFKLLGIYIEDTIIKNKLKLESTEIKYIDFKKKLKSGYFPIDNELYFLSKDKEVLKFKIDSKNLDIYSISDSLKININAIVGKNGSGKSTLLEIIYLMIYNLSINKKILNPTYPTKESAKEYYMPYLDASLVYKENNGNYHLIKFNIIDNSFVDLNIGKNKILFVKGITDDNGDIIFENEENEENQENQEFDLNDFVYSIALNYSIFGLNNEILGDWIQQLFHKNDGYQTPIVLNPYKEGGEYSVNNEISLSKDRILTNVMLSYESKKDFILIDDYFLNKIQYTLTPNVPKIKRKGLLLKFFNLYIDRGAPDNLFYKKLPVHLYSKHRAKKFDTKKEIYTFTESYFFLSNFIGDDNIIIINKILKINVIIENSFNKEYETIVNELVSYLYYKLVKIWITYYNVLDEIKFDHDEIIHQLDFIGLLNKVILDKSHKTLKFRRCLNFLLNINDYKSKFKIDNEIIKIEFDPEQFYAQCITIKSKNKVLNIDEILLPGCFKLNFTLNNEIDLHSLSSGELQKVLSIQTVFYHLLNLNSVAPNSKNSDPIKYKNVLVIFDEIELYFHPEYQRTFIKSLIDLLKYFSNILKDLRTIQILFATHSPFILSDIPSQNILKLNEGFPQASNLSHNSFAANVHDLLADEFFLENGNIGAFATQQIEIAINLLNYISIEREMLSLGKNVDSEILFEHKSKLIELGYWNEKKINTRDIESERKMLINLIEIIGEPIIKHKLSQMYQVVFGEAIDRKKEDVEAEIKLLAKEYKIDLKKIL